MTGMRIVHVITGLDTGGAEMMLLKLIDQSHTSFEHFVISLTTIGTIGRELTDRNVPVFGLGARSIAPLVTFVKLTNRLRTCAPNLVQGWMYHGNLAALAAKAALGAQWPLLWSVRCTVGDAGAEKVTTRAVRRIGGMFSGSAGAIIYNSDRARQQHEAIGFERSHGIVIPKGINTNIFRSNGPANAAFRNRFSIPSSCRVVGHVARVDLINHHNN